MEDDMIKSNNWESYKVPFIPDGTSGEWKIETFEISEERALWSEVRSTISSGERGRSVPEGSYKQLTKNGQGVMSDTRAEIWDHFGLFDNREGRVLLHGLGLGMAANGCLMSDELVSLTVVEISEDVIKLVAPALRRQHYKAYRAGCIEIIHDDALTWKPPRGRKWDFVFHDIWNDRCLDNWEEMKKLHRRFARRAINGQDSWSRDWVKYMLSLRRGF